MATHQEIAGITDEMLVQRMISSHGGRFDDVFWHHFDSKVAPGFPQGSVIADVGCGPGLFLRDLTERYPEAEFHGIDITHAMLDYGRNLDYPGNAPQYHLLDVSAEALPFEDHSVDFLSMVAVLHVLSDPQAMLAEIKRVLQPGGTFMLYDWIRQPLPDYLNRMAGDATPEQAEIARIRSMRLFADHNKYSREDWHWLLETAGYQVQSDNQVASPHFRLWFASVS